MSQGDFDALVLKLLSGVELFRQLEHEGIVTLLKHATKASYKADEVVFEEGFEGHSMYVVIQGSFEVYREVGGRKVHIADILPGDHFGEIALIANRPRSASVRAREPGIALRFSKQAILSEPKAGLHLFRNMARLMAQRLVHADEEIILHKTGQRVPAPTESTGLRTGAIRIRNQN